MGCDNSLVPPGMVNNRNTQVQGAKCRDLFLKKPIDCKNAGRLPD